MNRMDQAHAVFLRRLQQDFCDAITGKSIDVLDDGEHPQRHFLVGMLSPKDDQENAMDHSSVTVSQLGMDLLFDLNDLPYTELEITLSGDLFYRVCPTLDQQRNAFVEEAYRKKLIEKKEFSLLSQCDPEKLKKMNPQIFPVYKKIPLSAIIEHPLTLCAGDCFNASKGCGELPQGHPISQYIESCFQRVAQYVGALPEAYKKTSEPVTYADLLNEETWKSFCCRFSGNEFRPTWRVGLLCYTKQLSDDQVRVSIRIANDSAYVPIKPSGKNKSDVERVNDLYNTCLTVKVKSGSVLPVEMDYFHDDYKYDRKQYAIGSNCAVEVSEDRRTFRTTLMPVYEQKRLKTIDNPAVTFQELDDNCIAILTRVYQAMLFEKKLWETDLKNKRAADELTPDGIAQFEREIEGFECEIARFKYGIDLIERSPITRRAFQLMNKTFRDSPKGYKSWRKFQIVFIVSLIPDIVACDSDDDIMSLSERMKTKLKQVDLLYFPTGGGKTEVQIQFVSIATKLLLSYNTPVIQTELGAEGVVADSRKHLVNFRDDPIHICSLAPLCQLGVVFFDGFSYGFDGVFIQQFGK